MDGFWGSVKSTLDSKGRINFPAKFRKSLSDEDRDSLMLVRSVDKCISVYPLSSWRSKVDLIRSKVNSEREFGIVSRRLMYQGGEQKIDKQGRLNLPSELIEYAQLNGEVLIVGYENKIEIWNPDRYREFVETTEADFLKISRELDI